MKKRLPILLKLENDIFEEIELTKPSGRVIADTQEIAQKSSTDIAMRNFIAGCTEKIIGYNSEITDKVAIKSALGKTSNKNLEYLAIEIMTDYYDGDDFVEGIFECPICHEKQTARLYEEDGITIDTRDRISDLQVTFMQDESELKFDIELSEPVEIKVSSQSSELVENITMTYPTIEHYINAHSNVGDKNLYKKQYAAFGYAIIAINGVEVDDRWKRLHGLNLFLSIKQRKDIKQITDKINAYGVDKKLEKICKECGKVWQPFIDTSNFFGFGDQ